MLVLEQWEEAAVQLRHYLGWRTCWNYRPPTTAPASASSGDDGGSGGSGGGGTNTDSERVRLSLRQHPWAPFSSEWAALFKRRNALDYELYEYARQLALRRVAAIRRAIGRLPAGSCTAGRLAASGSRKNAK